MRTASLQLGASTVLDFTCNDNGSNATMVARYGKPTYHSRQFTEKDLPVCYQYYFASLKQQALTIMKGA